MLALYTTAHSLYLSFTCFASGFALLVQNGLNEPLVFLFRYQRKKGEGEKGEGRRGRTRTRRKAGAKNTHIHTKGRGQSSQGTKKKKKKKKKKKLLCTNARVHQRSNNPQKKREKPGACKRTKVHTKGRGSNESESVDQAHGPTGPHVAAKLGAKTAQWFHRTAAAFP